MTDDQWVNCHSYGFESYEKQDEKVKLAVS